MYYRIGCAKVKYGKEFRLTCSFIKNYYIGQNNYMDSNIFYALEMLAKGAELCFFKNPIDWLIFKFSLITSDHGQSVYYPVVCIMIVAILWSWVNPNIEYFIDIIFPFFGVIDIKDSISKFNNRDKFLYVFCKLISGVLWWQLIRAIRKDIKR